MCKQTSGAALFEDKHCYRRCSSHMGGGGWGGGDVLCVFVAACWRLKRGELLQKLLLTGGTNKSQALSTIAALLQKGFAARVTCGRDGAVSSGGLARERMERKQRAVNWRKPGSQMGKEEPACVCVLDWIFFFLLFILSSLCF